MGFWFDVLPCGGSVVRLEPFSGFEPETSSLPRKCSTTELKRQHFNSSPCSGRICLRAISYAEHLLSGKRDSNSQHSAWKADTLPIELLPRVGGRPCFRVGCAALSGALHPQSLPVSVGALRFCGCKDIQFFSCLQKFSCFFSVLRQKKSKIRRERTFSDPNHPCFFSFALMIWRSRLSAACAMASS